MWCWSGVGLTAFYAGYQPIKAQLGWGTIDTWCGLLSCTSAPVEAEAEAADAEQGHKHAKQDCEEVAKRSASQHQSYGSTESVEVRPAPGEAAESQPAATDIPMKEMKPEPAQQSWGSISSNNSWQGV